MFSRKWLRFAQGYFLVCLDVGTRFFRSSTKADKEHRHLLKSKIFWSAFLPPLLGGAVLAVLIAIHTDLGGVCFTSECVQEFFTHFKFPFAIAGLAIPFVAMAAAIHRSMEAALQIDLANKQYGEAIKNNRFGNFYKHREGFEKFIESYCAKRTYGGLSKSFVLSGSFYGKVFPDASFDNPLWNGEYSEKAVSSLDRHAKNILREIEKSTENFDCLSFLNSARFLVGYISLNFAPSRSVSFETKTGEKKRFLVPKMNTAELSVFCAVRDAVGVYIVLRGYIGRSAADLSVGPHMRKVLGHLKAHSENFKVS